MNRRGFLGSLAALAAAPFVPMPKALPPQTLGSFGATPSVRWDEWDELDEWYDPLHDPTYGPAQFPVRFDVLYGSAAVRPDLVCRVMK